MERNKIIALLKEYGVKPSVQRIAVLQYLDEHRTHPTVDEIFHDLNPQMPTLSKTTVYNVLHLLYIQGLIQFLTMDEKKIHFDFNTKPHVHFLCRECGKVYDIDDEINVPVIRKTEIEGHLVEEVQLYLKGVCRNCRKEKN